MADLLPETCPNRPFTSQTLQDLAILKYPSSLSPYTISLTLLSAEHDRLTQQIEQNKRLLAQMQIQNRASFAELVYILIFTLVTFGVHLLAIKYCHYAVYNAASISHDGQRIAEGRLRAVRAAQRRLRRFTPWVLLLVVMLRGWYERVALVVGHAWCLVRLVRLFIEFVFEPKEGEGNGEGSDWLVLGVEVVSAAVGAVLVFDPWTGKLRWG
ncbi:Hypothetical protein D9617_7g031510 [Elsinoe fawcettii]|nr:Hypothetical protein D9617_7g031510 [Elsinoe fawcettii]